MYSQIAPTFIYGILFNLYKHFLQSLIVTSNEYVSLLALFFLLIFFLIFLYKKVEKIKNSNNISLKDLHENNDLLISRLLDTINNGSDFISHSDTVADRDLKISSEIESRILKRLIKFENDNEYLDSSLKLTSMAELFETNTKYLSKIILKVKDKSFIVYIRELRIQYAKEQIELDKQFRMYKVEVIAFESGFKTAESFSKAFYNKYGVYPSKFIRETKKKN